MRATALLLLAALAGCRRSADAVDGTAIILVMDGVRLEESLGDDPSSATGESPSAFMPSTWSELLPQGVRASHAWSVGATTTTPAHAAIVSGRRQPLANYAVGGGPGLYRPELSGLFEAVRAQRGASEDQVVLVANTELVWPVDRSLQPDAAGAGWVWVSQDQDESVPAGDDRTVMAKLMSHLEEHPTRLAVVNLHQVDRSGHYGDDDDYLEDVRVLDEPIAELWGWLQEKADYRGDTTLVLVSDHGRHSHSYDNPHWRHHGDGCNGCRRVPALFLGPGMEQGVDYAEPLLLTDIAPTVAATLGLELPWAEGVVADGLFASPPGAASREGIASAALAEGLLAELSYSSDPSQRSSLQVAGSRLSDPASLLTEAPALAVSGERAWACFREVVLTPEEADTDWVARCFLSEDGGSSWESIGAPVADVGPHWEPVMVAEPSGDLLVAYVNNVNATATGGAEGEAGEVSLEVARWDGAWSEARIDDVPTFPTDLAAVISGDSLVVAVGGAAEGSEARHERDLWVGTVQLDEGLRWSASVAALELRAALGIQGSWRLERPALLAGEEGALLLAAVGQSEAGGHAVWAESPDRGQSWSRAGIVDLPHPVAPHVTPVWLGDRAVWVALDTATDSSMICAASLEQAPSCLRSGSPRVADLLVDEGRLHAIVDAGLGSWELESWGAEEL
jgi:hypothetical protein